MSPSDSESLRRAALEVLAPRHPAALPLRAIRRRFEIEALIDFEYRDPDLEAALELLRGLKYVAMVLGELGATKYWSATAEGVLAFERGLK